MNESKIATFIVEQINKTLHKQKKTLIVNFDILQSFFTSIRFLEND